ncbi:MAG: hypothetical protein O7C59_01255, partial [Rickettsia endosymbiont of Ixodes persulcatus]|nr:hypothetical protein [Rickettsia endosymbiont of Ixodes persulcatus]
NVDYENVNLKQVFILLGHYILKIFIIFENSHIRNPIFRPKKTNRLQGHNLKIGPKSAWATPAEPET